MHPVEILPRIKVTVPLADLDRSNPARWQLGDRMPTPEGIPGGVYIIVSMDRSTGEVEIERWESVTVDVSPRSVTEIVMRPCGPMFQVKA